MLPEQLVSEGAVRSNKQERMSQALRLLGGEEAHMAQLPPFPVRGADGHCGRSQPLLKPQPLESLVILDSSVQTQQCIRNLWPSSYLVIGYIIVRAHSLNLRWGKHPTDVINDFYICWRRLEKGKLSSRRRRGFVYRTFFNCNNLVACIRCSN